MTATDLTSLVARILARCEEEGACLLWRGALTALHGYPQISSAGRTLSARRVMYEATNGPITPSCVVSYSCGDNRCMRHLVELTQVEAIRAAVARGAYGGAVRTRKMVATKRARSAISEALVEQIRAAEATSREIAAATGVSSSHVKAIRRGAARAPLASPLGGLGAR